jgi:2-polyprenyl-3-methyl-5-hydroxy-6-metoxy-1,4-benzoquinol methylase
MLDPRFRERLAADELMDDPAAPAAELRGALAQLESINRWLSGFAPSRDGIRRLLPAGCRELTLLDVGSGAGDMPRRIVEWAAGRGLRARVLGIDLSAVAVELARARTPPGAAIEHQAQDLFSLEGEERFDIVHASLALHHFNGESAVAALAHMLRLARWGLVLNDLHRHFLAYHSFRALSALFWRNRLIRHDGPISVRRGFRRGELAAMLAVAGAARCEVRWRWPFRWQAVAWKRRGLEA